MIGYTGRPFNVIPSILFLQLVSKPSSASLRYLNGRISNERNRGLKQALATWWANGMQRRQFLGFVEDFYGAFLDGDPDAESSKPREAAHVRALQNFFRLLLDGLESGNFEPFTEAMTEDIVYLYKSSDNHPFEGGYRGRAAVLEHVEANFQMIRDQTPAVTWLVAQGDRVVLGIHETGWMIPGNWKYDCEMSQIFTFRDGLISRFQMYGIMTPLGDAN